MPRQTPGSMLRRGRGQGRHGSLGDDSALLRLLSASFGHPRLPQHDDDGAVDGAGVTGFLGNLETFYESADLEGAVWRQFVGAWAEAYGEDEVAVAALFKVALTIDGIDMGKGSERSQRTSFGLSLNRQRDRVIGEYRIVQTRKVKRVQRWRLIKARPGQNPFDMFYGPNHEPEQPHSEESEERHGDRWTQ